MFHHSNVFVKVAEDSNQLVSSIQLIVVNRKSLENLKIYLRTGRHFQDVWKGGTLFWNKILNE